MGACKDPALTYLSQYGYNVVRLPRAGIEPLDVLGKDKSLERLGALGAIWSSPVPPPAPNPPRAVADLAGLRSSDLDTTLGLGILASALAGLGKAVGLPTLTASYSRARKLQFTFTGAVSVGVDPFAVGDYLAAGSLDLRNPVVARYFGESETREYVITEVLKTDSLGVAAKGEDGVKIGIDHLPIAQALEGKVSVERSSTAADELTYKGPEAITFGFKAIEVLYSDGAWAIRGVPASADLAFARPAGDVETVLFNTEGFVRL
jgi:hypothetical protein